MSTYLCNYDVVSYATHWLHVCPQGQDLENNKFVYTTTYPGHRLSKFQWSCDDNLSVLGGQNYYRVAIASIANLSVCIAP